MEREHDPSYSQGWADRAALEFEAHRYPDQLAIRLGVCMGALRLLYQEDPATALDIYGQLLAKVPASVLFALTGLKGDEER